MVPFSLRPAVPSDSVWIAELRAVVLRPDLERLGRFDETRVRRRFTDGFVPGNTLVIVADGTDAGAIARRREADAVWIEHFYLRPEWQGRGLGGAVLAQVLDEIGAMGPAGLPRRLNVLQGSPARRLYERHGFIVDSEDDVDVFLTLAG